MWTDSLISGRDPFNQNFRKLRSKTEWICLVQPEKFRKNQSTFRGGPLLSVGPVGSKWTIPIHSQSQDLAVRYLPCTKWRKILITALLWIVNSLSIGVTCTSMYSYHRSVACFSSKVHVSAVDGSLRRFISLENLECSFCYLIRFFYF